MYTAEVEVQLLRAIVEQYKLACLQCIEYIEMLTEQQSTLNKHSHFHLAVFLTLCDKALSFLGVTS